MAKVEIKSKEAKMKAAMSGGKAKRKKWSKGKVREKLQNAVQFDQKVLDRMLLEVPKVCNFGDSARVATCVLQRSSSWARLCVSRHRKAPTLRSHFQKTPLPPPW